MGWVSMDRVFDDNSRHYADCEYRETWGPYQNMINGYEEALKNHAKYSREAVSQEEFGL